VGVAEGGEGVDEWGGLGWVGGMGVSGWVGECVSGWKSVYISMG